MIPAVDALLKDIRNKRIAPVYLVHGDEPYYLDRIAEELEKVAVPVAERGFNQFVLFGKDTDVGAVLNYARRYPFMAERQLVLVKEAQQMAGIGDKSAQTLLEDYALNPLSSTILMLCYTKEDGKPGLDERKAWVKAFGAKGKLLGVKKIYDNKVPDWVGEYCREQGVKVSPKACQLLADHIGNDLKRLAGEIDKILINLHVGEEISAATVERLVGISKEYNVFELQKALCQRDVVKANQIVDYFARNPKDNPLVVILAQLFSYFGKVLLVQSSKDQSEKALASLLGVNPFFVKDYLSAARTFPLLKVADIIHAIRRADALSKGIEAPTMHEGDILRELVFSVLH
ncbi:DNA polymerase III subunit delta [Spirosoma terrae]|uniref:DNA polymerase III subunit delta n=1 Tax=Spirosoma terrae TaxID=1968276 RepID=A0A6L9L859_9BACT|nr:DNA polymerase III subunit delta [Spirosoma terrae]NDU95311.1 DNA polymerase III subunit delta [Spirosoma terrae]